MRRLLFFYISIFVLNSEISWGQIDQTKVDNMNLDSAVYISVITLENPNGFGGSLGVISVGLAVQSNTRLRSGPEANAGAYFGLGDPVKYLGLGATVNIYGLSNSYGTKNNLGQGGLDLDINRLVGKKLFLKFGVKNITTWGASERFIHLQKSYYGVGSFFILLNRSNLKKAFSSLSVTLGAGNGLFRQDKNYTPYSSGHLNPIMSIGTPLSARTTAVFERNGYDIGVGVSSYIIFFKSIPIHYFIQATDLILKQPRFTLSVNYTFNIAKTYLYELSKK